MKGRSSIGLALVALAALSTAAAVATARWHPWLQPRLLDAVIGGRPTTTRLWLALGGSPVRPLDGDDLRRAPLHWACAVRDPGTGLRIARMLLDAGAAVDARTTTGATPLLWCASYGRRATVAALLDAGAAIDAREAGGRTALMVAARLGNVDLTRLLLERGADPDLRDADGKTALELAEEGRREAAAAVLRSIAAGE